MKFTELYKMNLKYWPSEIDISDAHLQEGDGCYFPKLSRVWDQVENNKLAPLQNLMVWAVFCGLHKMAMSTLKYGDATSIKISEIDLIYVESKFSESLFSPDGEYEEQMRLSYVNDIKS